MAVHEVLKTRCPFCGHRLDRAANAPGDPRTKPPGPGDAALCMECAQFSVYDEGGERLRKPTATELALIQENPCALTAVEDAMAYRRLRGMLDLDA